MKYIESIEQKVICGERISYDEALELINSNEVNILLNSADNIRKHFMGNRAELCSIMNAKSGKCSENCKYCAQSVHFHTDVTKYSLVSKEEALKMALENEKNGVHRFSLVTSGRGLKGKEFENIIEIFKHLKNNTSIKLCASLGILNYDQMIELKHAGVERYHHNIETSREFYTNICTTHTFQDRIDTIKNAHRANIDVCSGGIIGLGESCQDRISMAFELKKMNIKSIPINILNPIKGTPLENAAKVDKDTILKTMAVFRFINPNAYIRYAGGRINLGDRQKEGLCGGINAALTGNLLTTVGNKTNDDIKMFNELGFEV